ncbi:MAG: cysteine--tRNA ligase [Actinomycetota bacterium]
MRLYNSLSRQVEEVDPVDGKTVKMYSCGPTVYRYIHIGNMRSFMLGDLIRRALRFEGRDVNWVMNITDVGHMTDEVTDTGRDKMELAMDDEGLSPQEIAQKYTDAFLQDADLVGIERADLYPRASDHIPEMIEIIKRLIDKGHAYEVEGTVYFDVTTFPDYGKLSGNTLEALRAGHRQETVQDPNKRHPADFALWKKAGQGRLLKWPSPWGDGYPGWHIECSAMSMKHLGERFDIHTGGNDNKFPHHEDEIAQSEGAVGHRVVSIWVHGGFLQMSGQKMAKSARNIKRVVDLAEQGIDPLAYRLLCFGTRYKSEMDFSWEALEGAQSRLTHFRQRMADWVNEPPPDGSGQVRAGALSEAGQELDGRFRDAIAEDLDLPAALVVVEELRATTEVPGNEKFALLSSWDHVLGLDLGRLAREGFDVPEEIQALVRERDEARQAKDYARSDAIRDRLTEMGWEAMDTAEGTKVRPKLD